MNLYSDFITTKNNSIIPLLKTGKTIESRYNPDKDAENIINNFDREYNAFLILGIGSGILIEKICERFPTAMIIAFDFYDEDIEFLEANTLIRNRINKKNIIKATLKTLSNILINNYIPAKHGDIKIVYQQNWTNDNQNLIIELNKIMTDSLQVISSDFSVQSHFGKIWTQNILNNIKSLSNISKKIELNFDSFDKAKKVYIIAAGPSLDKNISKILNDKNCYIISTDTGFQILQKYNITPDFVISIDGQNISHNHFINEQATKSTVFLFDLAGDFSAVKYLIDNNNIAFFISGNPLAIFFNNYIGNNLPYLFSGAGTVTITALDFAIKAGFKNIQVLGADFCYSEGKTYAKGSYLDSLYNLNTNKTLNNEYLYDRLMFRTDLYNIDKQHFTNTILDSYKKSFCNYLSSNQIKYTYSEGIYYINNLKNINLNIPPFDFNFKNFLKNIIEAELSETEVCLLPLVAYYRKKMNYDKNISYTDFLKLAHSFIVSYNEDYEK